MRSSVTHRVLWVRRRSRDGRDSGRRDKSITEGATPRPTPPPGVRVSTRRCPSGSFPWGRGSGFDYTVTLSRRPQLSYCCRGSGASGCERGESEDPSELCSAWSSGSGGTTKLVQGRFCLHNGYTTILFHPTILHYSSVPKEESSHPSSRNTLSDVRRKPEQGRT